MCVATSNGGIDVAPVSKERVDPILENYLLALAGVDQCSQNAPETVRSRLAVNLERAERAYADAAADGLVEVSADMEAELCALARGNGQSRRRLHGGCTDHRSAGRAGAGHGAGEPDRESGDPAAGEEMNIITLRPFPGGQPGEKTMHAGLPTLTRMRVGASRPSRPTR